MSKQENLTWEELEQLAKDRLKLLMEQAPAQVQLEACSFILSRDLEDLKYVESKGGKSSSIYAEEE